jgi:hypothetical protein
MSQGRKNVADQFQFSWATTEDREHTLLYAVFRQSFAIAATTANDRTKFLDKGAHRFRVFVPGEIRDPIIRSGITNRSVADLIQGHTDQTSRG